MNKEKLIKSIKEYLDKLLDEANKFDVASSLDERNEREDYYQQFDKEKILSMSQEEFYVYISKLWAMLLWGNKRYVIDKIILENGFENLKNNLSDLLFGKNNFEQRWDSFKENVKGFGPAMMSELLCYTHPNDYMLWNRTAYSAYLYLEVKNIPKHNYQFTGKKYLEMTEYAKEIQSEFIKLGYEDADLLFVDYFLWEQLRNCEPIKKEKIESNNVSVINNKSYHNEIIDKIKNIGNMLGYDTSNSGKITNSGKIPDAVWEFNVGNIGMIKYVFEVQDSGSIDSLIVSLMNSSQDISVQAVIAVTDDAQINKIKLHCNNINSSFNGKLKFWNISDVEKADDYLSTSMEIINNVLSITCQK